MRFIRRSQPAFPKYRPLQRRWCRRRSADREAASGINADYACLVLGMNEQSSLPPTEVTAASIEQLSLSEQFDSTERVHRLHHHRHCDNKLAAGGIMPRNAATLPSTHIWRGSRSWTKVTANWNVFVYPLPDFIDFRIFQTGESILYWPAW